MCCEWVGVCGLIEGWMCGGVGVGGGAGEQAAASKTPVLLCTAGLRVDTKLAQESRTLLAVFYAAAVDV